MWVEKIAEREVASLATTACMLPTSRASNERALHAAVSQRLLLLCCLVRGNGVPFARTSKKTPAAGRMGGTHRISNITTSRTSPLHCCDPPPCALGMTSTSREFQMTELYMLLPVKRFACVLVCCCSHLLRYNSCGVCAAHIGSIPGATACMLWMVCRSCTSCASCMLRPRNHRSWWLECSGRTHR